MNRLFGIWLPLVSVLVGLACSCSRAASLQTESGALTADVVAPIPDGALSPLPSHVPSPTPSPAPSSVPSNTRQSPGNGPTPTYTYRIVNVYPHDRNAFTQGLVFEEGVLYESTGLRGRSSLRRVALQSGDVLQIYSLPSQYFGEGLTLFADKLIQLTWQSHIGFVYDKESFELLGTFSYPTEGWGVTHDGQRLIMSDGTAVLHFLDPATFEEIGRIQVYDDNGPVVRLNELEYLQGEVLANVWQTDRIARIDPETGRVNAWIDLEGLLTPEDYSEPVDVLNGIAYDAAEDRLFITGKLWPKLFEVELIFAYRVFLPLVGTSSATPAFDAQGQ